MSDLRTINRQWMCIAAIAAVVCAVYAPSLWHFPRGDQIGYLAEVATKHSLWDLTLGSFDLNRTRAFNYGDGILFRPVVYFLLGAEKYFFGYAFPLWQALGIAVHLGVIAAFYRLLNTVRPGWAAVWFTSFFALLFVNIEMVTWHHVTAYMIFVLLCLIALRHVFLILEGRGHEQHSYAKPWWAFFAAAFTHELTTVMAMMVSATLFALRPGDRRYAVALLAIPVVYIGISFWNWTVVHPPLGGNAGGPGAVDIGVCLQEGMAGLAAWLYVGLFPFNVGWGYAARTMANIEPGMVMASLARTSPAALYAWGLLGTYAFVLLRAGRSMSKPQAAMMGVCVGVALIFAGAVFFGRGAFMDVHAATWGNLHYLYIFWAFVLVALYTPIDWSKADRRITRLLCCLAAALIVLNATKIFMGNLGRARENQNNVVLAQSLQRLIAREGRAKDFSFYVAPDYPGNFLCGNVYRRGDSKGRQYSVMEALFPQYFNPIRPKYTYSSPG